MLHCIASKNRNKALIGFGGLAAAMGLGYYVYNKTSLSNKPVSIPVRSAPGSGLSKKMASDRRANISGDVSYDLYIVYHETEKKYQGCVEIHFEKTKWEGSLYLDFTGQITRLEINGN